MTWNNLGVSYGEIEMRARSVRAFRKSAEGGNTLAMSNLGNKLLNGGFFEEANELCRKALALPSYDKSVPIMLNRLQAIDDDEDQKLKEALEKVKSKAAFYRELGRSAVVETPRAITATWTAPEGALRAELMKDELKLTGNYEVPASRLAGILAGGRPLRHRTRGTRLSTQVISAGECFQVPWRERVRGERLRSWTVFRRRH